MAPRISLLQLRRVDSTLRRQGTTYFRKINYLCSPQRKQFLYYVTRSISSEIPNKLALKPWKDPVVESHGDYRAESFLEAHIGGPLVSEDIANGVAFTERNNSSIFYFSV